MSDQFFEAVNSVQMVNRVQRAHHRVCYVTPSVHQPMADALVAAAERLSWNAVHVVVDIHPEVCRLGYGDIAAIKMLQERGCRLRNCPGVRLGVLIVDEWGTVFAPTALYIEREPQSFETPNGIVVSISEAERIAASIAPEPATDAMRTDTPVIGQSEVTPDEIRAAEKDLKERPPVAPDLARAMRVLTSRIQIVKIEFKGSKPGQRKLALSASDLGVDDEELKKHVLGSWKLFDKEIAAEIQPLQEKRDALSEKYLIPLGRYGSALRFENRPAFEAEMKAFQKEVEAKREALRKAVGDNLTDSRKRLKRLLVDSLKKSPSDALKKTLFEGDLKERQMEREAERLIEKAHFPHVEKILGELDCTYHILNLSEHVLLDEEFRELVEDRFGCSVEELTKIETAVPVKDGQRLPGQGG